MKYKYFSLDDSGYLPLTSIPSKVNVSYMREFEQVYGYLPYGKAMYCTSSQYYLITSYLTLGIYLILLLILMSLL